MRIIYFIVGTVFLILGLVGLMFPVIPQVPFLVISAVAFCKASKRFNARLLKILDSEAVNKRFGSMAAYDKIRDTLIKESSDSKE